jgi:hypothetical protein
MKCHPCLRKLKFAFELILFSPWLPRVPDHRSSQKASSFLRHFMQFNWMATGEARGAVMRRNSHPKKRMVTEGSIFICFIQLLTASAAFAQNTHPGPPGSPYVVDGLALGARIDFESPIYRSYQCSPSEQFPQFTRCQRTQKQQIVGSRRSVDSTSSLLHNSDGVAVYINRYIAPVIFDRNEIQSEINRLSSKFGERAHEMRMPQREGLPNAVIGLWGKVQLEQLDADGVSILASGQSPRKGLLIDYLGDLRRSAQLGLPIYSLNGGAGYLWSASIDRSGRSHVRLLTVDASALTLTTARQQSSAEIKEPEEITTESTAGNAELARVEIERAKIELPTTENAELARVETERAKLEPQKGEIEKVAASDTPNADAAVVENTTAFKGAALGFIVFFVILALPLLAWRAKTRARRRQFLNSGTYDAGVPQRKLLEQNSVASPDISPEAIVIDSEPTKEVSQPPAANLQPCCHCSCEISTNDNFCMHCGASVASKGSAGLTRPCSSCRNQIGISDKYCRYCGASYIAVAAPSMNLSNEGDYEAIAKTVRGTRKLTARRKKAIKPQAANSQRDGKRPNEEAGMTGDPAPNDMPKENGTAVVEA